MASRVQAEMPSHCELPMNGRLRTATYPYMGRMMLAAYFPLCNLQPAEPDEEISERCSVLGKSAELVGIDSIRNRAHRIRPFGLARAILGRLREQWGDLMQQRDYLFRARVSEQLSKMICANPVVRQMTPGQLATMHVFKHEVLSAFHRVYITVPANFADPLLKEFLKALPDLLEEDHVPSEDDQAS